MHLPELPVDRVVRNSSIAKGVRVFMLFMNFNLQRCTEEIEVITSKAVVGLEVGGGSGEYWEGGVGGIWAGGVIG